MGANDIEGIPPLILTARCQPGVHARDKAQGCGLKFRLSPIKALGWYRNAQSDEVVIDHTDHHPHCADAEGLFFAVKRDAMTRANLLQFRGNVGGRREGMRRHGVEPARENATYVGLRKGREDCLAIGTHVQRERRAHCAHGAKTMISNDLVDKCHSIPFKDREVHRLIDGIRELDK